MGGKPPGGAFLGGRGALPSAPSPPPSRRGFLCSESFASAYGESFESELMVRELCTLLLGDAVLCPLHLALLSAAMACCA